MAKMTARGFPFQQLDAEPVLAKGGPLPATGAVFLQVKDPKVPHENVMNLYLPLLLAKP
jgi:hypothetical protein